jgi:hypothetical protein
VNLNAIPQPIAAFIEVKSRRFARAARTQLLAAQAIARLPSAQN